MSGELKPEELPIGTTVRTRHGNHLRKFDNGWSPQVEWGNFDRWTVYSAAEVARDFGAVWSYGERVGGGVDDQ